MRREKAGRAVFDVIVNECEKFGLHQRVETARRLVEDEELRSVLHGAYDAHLLAVAERQLGDALFGVDLEALAQHGSLLRAVGFSDICRHFYHIAHLHRRIEHRLRRHISDIAQNLLALGSDILAEHADTARVKPDKSEHGADRGRFARAVGTEESENIPLADTERNVAHAPVFAVALCQIFDFDNIFHLFFRLSLNAFRSSLRIFPSAFRLNL